VGGSGSGGDGDGGSGEGDDDYLRRAYRECAEMVRKCGGAGAGDGDGDASGSRARAAARGGGGCVGRIALQPPVGANRLARFLRALRGLLRGSRACAVVVFPVVGLYSCRMHC
jgi:hypothetical protein